MEYRNKLVGLNYSDCNFRLTRADFQKKDDHKNIEKAYKDSHMVEDQMLLDAINFASPEKNEHYYNFAC